MKDQQGQSLLLVTSMIFIFIIYSLLLTSSVLTTNKVTRFRETKQIDLWIAEAGIEKALYCFNDGDDVTCGGSSGESYVGESAVSMAPGEFTTTVTTINPDERTIVSVATYKNLKRTIRKVLYKHYKTDDVSIDHGLHVGNGGLIISGDSTIDGDVYSNSGVTCSAGTMFDDVTLAGVSILDGCIVSVDARANTINDSVIAGDAYYQLIDESPVAGTKYPGSPDPSAISSFISPELIDQWKLLAAEGTYINSDLVITEDTSLGPAEITGSLSFDGDISLTITGVIYVHGNAVFNNRTSLALHPSFADSSGVIIADGPITADNAGKFYQTPQGGVITLISTYTSTSAISVSKSIAGANDHVSACAPYGGLLLSKGARVKFGCGNHVNLSTGARIDFTETAGYEERYLSDILLETTWEIREGTRNE